MNREFKSGSWLYQLEAELNKFTGDDGVLADLAAIETMKAIEATRPEKRN